MALACLGGLIVTVAEGGGLYHGIGLILLLCGGLPVALNGIVRIWIWVGTLGIRPGHWSENQVHFAAIRKLNEIVSSDPDDHSTRILHHVLWRARHLKRLALNKQSRDFLCAAQRDVYCILENTQDRQLSKEATAERSIMRSRAFKRCVNEAPAAAELVQSLPLVRATQSGQPDVSASSGSFQLDCPHCGQAVSFLKEHFGLEVNCPGCDLPFIVPNERDVAG